MSDRHDVAAPHKDMGLTEGDAAIDHLRSSGHDEEGVSILLELGALVRFSGILDCQVMQSQLFLYPRQQFEAGLQQPEPHHVTGAFRPHAGIAYRSVGDTPSASVDARGDDAVLQDVTRRRDGSRSHGYSLRLGIVQF